MGESQQLAPSATIKGQAENRRTVVTLLQNKGIVRGNSNPSAGPHSKAKEEKTIMRAATFLLAVAVAAGVPGNGEGTDNGGAGVGAGPYTTSGSTGQWFASGFVGSNFGASLHNNLNLDNVDINNDNNNSSFDFGGNIGYTWNRVVGVEFLADFTPSFGISNNSQHRRRQPPRR